MAPSNKQKHAKTRRWFIKTMAVVGAVAAAPKTAWAFFMSWFPVRTVEIEDFSFDPATGNLKLKGKGQRPYSLQINGLVERPADLSWAEINALPQHEQVSDFHCVEGWSVADVRWGGLRMQQIVDLARPKPEAKYVVFHSLGRTRGAPGGFDHYVESFPLEAALDPERRFILAIRQDGEFLSHAHGAPLRVISPLDLAYKSAKYVQRIEFSDKPQPGWWTMANPIYGINAPVPKRRLRGK